MVSWCNLLREKKAKWFWEAFDGNGRFVCRSQRTFRYAWEAFRDFELQKVDHEALMRCR